MLAWADELSTVPAFQSELDQDQDGPPVSEKPREQQVPAISQAWPSRNFDRKPDCSPGSKNPSFQRCRVSLFSLSPFLLLSV